MCTKEIDGKTYELVEVDPHCEDCEFVESGCTGKAGEECLKPSNLNKVWKQKIEK